MTSHALEAIAGTTAIAKMDASLTQLSDARNSYLQPATDLPAGPFTAVQVASWVPDREGNARCRSCSQRSDELTVVDGLCVRCLAGTEPVPAMVPLSEPFWLLTPDEILRAEPELQRLDAKAKALDQYHDSFPELAPERVTILEAMDAVRREALLLHMLRNASRQYWRTTIE